MKRSYFWCSIVATVLLGAQSLFAQTDLKPAIRWSNDGAGNWSDDGNWEGGTAPGEGEIASVRNGGTAEVSSAVGAVDDLAIANGAVDVQNGGALDIAGSLIVGGDGNLSLGSGGSVSSNSLAVIGTLSLGGGTIATSSAAFDPASTIDLPAGTDLSFGSSTPFLTTGSLTSQQPNFTVGGASPSLDRGLGLRLTQAGTVDVGSTPIAVVDRASGNVSLTNAAGGPVGLRGFTITSGNALLSDFGQPGGWTEAVKSSTEFTQISLDSIPLNVGESIDLGTGWGGTTVSPREEDLGLSVLLDDGTILAGGVEYTGPANDLVLNVNPETGAATLQNMSASVGDFDLISYSISSPSGSLNVEGLTGLGDGWDDANLKPTLLTELNLTGSTLFSNGTAVNLGNIFSVGGTQDLELTYGVVDSTRAQPGTVEYEADCVPNQGDIDGNGIVEFADFLTLSGNFGNTVDLGTGGDTDCNGLVDFADFLNLSGNFGNSVGGAAAVPEPSAGFLALLGVLGMLKFRKRGLRAAGLLIVAGVLLMGNSETYAQEIATRFIRIHPEGPNGQINNAVEAQGILNGTVLDVIINDDIEGAVATADFGGGGGSFGFDQNPWGNGDDTDGMIDFIQQISGVFTIPEGDWTVGFGSDDGGFLRFTNPDVVFIDTFNENGPVVDGDGEIVANAPRGHSWTAGIISVPAGGLKTGLESLMHERGGGDSFEVAIVDFHYDPDVDGGLNEFMAGNAIELDNAGSWTLENEPFVPVGASNDLNGDGNVNGDDFTYLANNWGGSLNFDTLHALATELSTPAGAASVPEPNGFALIGVALAMILGIRRQRS